jgi:hypothetical protein
MQIILDGPIKSTTELSSDTSRILDVAATQPVTIRRDKPKEPIVLVTRDVALSGMAAQRLVEQVLALTRYALLREGGTTAAYPLEFEWLREFDSDEVREFTLEFADAVQAVLRDGAPMLAADSVIEQWRKSAAVLRDEALRARLADELQNASAGRKEPVPG